VSSAGRLRAVVVSGLLLLTTTACSPPTPVAPTTQVTSHPAPGATLNASQFKAASQLPNTVLLDVRSPAEFADGHLAGARNLDVNSPGFAAEAAKLDPARQYAVYCRSGNRSQTAMNIMQSKGITGVYHLGGGISAWTSAGGQLIRGQ
jgi:rhodanese-related sulfurtransferase